ncbi:MAG: hypothetical protein R3C16_02305 [Hyphomonadaceae bacterium]
MRAGARHQHDRLAARHAPNPVPHEHAVKREASAGLSDELIDHLFGQRGIVLKHKRVGVAAAHAADEARDRARLTMRCAERGEFRFRFEWVRRNPHHVNTSFNPAISMTSAKARRKPSVE